GDSQTTGLTDTLPAGMVFGTGTPTAAISGGGATGTCSVAGQTMTCAFGVLAAGKTATVTVPARVTTYPSGGLTQNCASASTSEVDPNSGNSVSICTPLTVQRSSIAGTVFQDRDRTGPNAGTPQAAATEPRIAGVAVQLSGTDAYGNAVSLSTTTDASGNYSFTNLSPADASGYTVTETQPTSFVNGPTAPPAPAAGGTYAGGGSAGNSSYGAIQLAANASGTGYDFPEVRQPSLSGFVYADVNLNNIRNPGIDSAIAGATVRLLNANTLALVATTTTDGTGAYTFANLDPLIAYTLEEPLPSSPAGLANGPVNPGLVNGAACASGCTAQPNTPIAGTDRIAAIDLGAGTDGTQFNFGEQQVSTISGFVFADVNNNGVQNLPGDIGLAGVTIVLTGTDATSATINRTTTTAADGNLLPGTYTVTEPTQPAGSSNGLTIPGTGGGSATSVATLPSAISGIVLTAAANASANNFAEIPSSSAIAGRVWLDANNNGSIDASEGGIAGVTIELTGTDANGPVSRTATTDATGVFSFGTLAPGVYTLREPTQPTGTLNGRTIAGTIGGSTSGTATNVATLPSAISTITLGVGQNSVANLFGEVPTSTIAGRVYGDNNNNGSIDAGETGLAGVTITLSGTDDLGAPVNLATTTVSDGSYTFASLRPGTYAVTEPLQPGGTTNGITSAGSAGGNATAPSITPSAITAIVLAPGVNSTQNNFGEIGNSPDLLVSKDHALPRFTVHNAASYRIRVRNAGELATTGDYTVTDRLPVGLTLAATPSGAGWSCVGAAGASVFSCSATAVIASGAANPSAIDVSVTVGPQAATNSPVHNVVLVEGGGEPDARRPTTAERDAAVNNPASLPVCNPAISHSVCRDPTVVQLAASLAGTVWYDGGSVPSLLDGGDTRLAGWQVEVVNTTDNTIVARAVTGTDGSYRVPDLLPGVALAVRFREPQSGVVFGYPVNGEQSPGSSGAGCNPSQALANGTSSSCVDKGTNPQLGVVLAAGQDLTQQSLPVDPSGVVYDAGVRTPVAGAVVTLAPTGVCNGWNPASSVVGASLGGYSVNGSAISMTVGASGFYQFLFAASAPASCQFGLSVTPPDGYTFVSKLIPPQAGSLTPSGATGTTYAVQPQSTAPTGAVGSATAYYLGLVSGSAGANIVHNHIPLDPALPNGISLSKTGDKSVAEIGDSVRYSIAVQLTSGELPRQLTVLDRLPAGFTFIKGTASVNGVAIADPIGGAGPRLAFNLGPMPADGKFLLQYRLRVGVGSQQGDGINRAIGYACGVPSGCLTAAFAPVASSLATNEAQHQVRVTGGVFAPEACVAGKIFVDCNGNQIQDREELGIPGVRLLLQDGTTLISDSEGKYSYCGLPPRSAVLKVDSSTLPRGSRLVTSSNRNLGDANSLWLDLKNGELHRADFIEGSCSNPVLDQTKARRAQGEVRAPEAEKKGPALRFDSKAHGLSSTSSPQQGTDGANQTVPKARAVAPASSPSGPPPPSPPPGSPSTSTTATETKGGSDAAR
ncbi:MAG: SdrD B-like domain-containing protein, partial [Burkholderiales bacterium]